MQNFNENRMFILPAGEVLFGKRNVALKEVPSQWGEGTIVVYRKENGKIHFVCGCQGEYSSINEQHECVHDQTQARMGTWTVINEIPYRIDEKGTVHWNPKVPFTADFNEDTRAPLAVFK
jgi:hypothetical protein